MIPAKDAQLILQWLHSRLGDKFTDFKVDVDPKKQYMRIRTVCRICRFPVMNQACWLRPRWDTALAEGTYRMGEAHAKWHDRKITGVK